MQVEAAVSRVEEAEHTIVAVDAVQTAMKELGVNATEAQPQSQPQQHQVQADLGASTTC